MIMIMIIMMIIIIIIIIIRNLYSAIMPLSGYRALGYRGARVNMARDTTRCRTMFAARTLRNS